MLRPIIAAWSHSARASGCSPVSIVLGVMIVPTIAAISEDALRSMPDGIREASYAMGATTWQTIWRVLLPAAKIGIIDADHPRDGPRDRRDDGGRHGRGQRARRPERALPAAAHA